MYPKHNNMYQLKNNFSLKENNTFAIPAVAKYYLTLETPADLYGFFQNNSSLRNEKRLFLGAGSNLLFVHDFDGLVIHPQIGGIRIVKEAQNHVEVEVGAGVVWDHFVEWCVNKGFYGVENLSLIPGNVGAVPVQNIGAYGAEASSVISRVKGIDLESNENIDFLQKDCLFGYRTSLFKEKLKEQFLVTSVNFQLTRKPGFKIQYEGLEAKVSQFGEINLQNIRRAIIAIREIKLPNPAVFGNAGSFFKNPIVSALMAKSLQKIYPGIPIYPIGADLVKVAAGWLIDKAGWKGRIVGNAAIHENQALVIINKGGATGEEIFNLSKLVAADVLQKFNIELEREVQVL